MAIQFARVERVSRSQGKNACCKSAYNSRSIIHDKQTNVIYNFERLKDRSYHEILLPSHVENKFKNVKTLSNEVEITENRKNSQLYKEYVLALPDDKNVSLDVKKEMVYEFIKEHKFIENNLSVQIDIHKPHDGEKNWHAHLLVTTRRFKENGLELGEKARDLEPHVRGGRKNTYVQSDKEINIGESWKEVQHKIFEKHGLENRVDEIAKEPGVHLGPVRMRGLMNEVIQFHQERETLKEPIFQNGNDLLDHVTEKSAVFSYEDLKRAVKGVDDKVVQLRLINEATQSERLISLYRGNGSDTGKWTTKEVRNQEERALRIADGIHRNTTDVFNENNKNAIQNLVTENSLSKHQATALSSLVATDKAVPALRILQGRAGTGKSHVLGQLNRLAKAQQHVIGLSPTHKAVAELKAQGFDHTDTVKGFLFKYRHNKVTVPKGSLFVIDEASMLGTESALKLLKIARLTEAEVLLSGDDRQLSAIEYGGLFKVLSDRYGSTTLDVVRRQANEWGKSVSEAFSKGDIFGGITVLQEQDKLSFSDNAATSLSQLLSDWSKSPERLSDRLILSIANKDVDVLNQGAREILKAQGRIRGFEFKITNPSGHGIFAEGDRIVMSETDKNLGIKNGDFGIIRSAIHDRFVIDFDDKRTIAIDPRKITFKHGYAATVFKSQGASVNDVYVYHNGFATKHNTYVEMSRHVKDLHFYCNKEATQDISVLADQLSRNLESGSSLQYKTSQDLTEQDTSLLGKLRGWVNDKVVDISDRLHRNEAYYDFKQQSDVPQNTVKAVLQKTHEVSQKAVGAEYAITVTSNMADTERSIANTQKSVTCRQHSSWSDDVARVRHDLKFNAERVSLDLLGSPNKSLSTNSTLRFGENGKIAVEISGVRQGVWHDFSAGKGGDMLALIQREKGLDFKGSFQLAKTYSFSDSQPDTVSELPLRQMVKTLTDQEKQTKLQSLYKQSLALNHSKSEVARSYLKGRGIENLSDFMHSNHIRYVENLWNASLRENQGALVVFAKDSENNITGTQATYLDINTNAKVTEGAAKRSFGKISGSFVEIQDANHGVTILAEGVETALSLKEAGIPGKIVAALGVHNFKNYPVQANEAIIIARDNDGKNAHTEKAIEKAVTLLSEKSAQVSTVMPAQVGDFNDVLITQGKAAIQKQLMPTVSPYFEHSWLMAWEKEIQYNSDTEKQTKDKENYRDSEAAGELKIVTPSITQQPETGNAQSVQTTHSESLFTDVETQYNADSVNADIAKNYNAIKPMIDGKNRTFDGYFLYVGKNYQINHLIDYNSAPGKFIKAALERDLQMILPDRCLAGLKEHYADQSNDKVVTSPDKKTPFGISVNDINMEAWSKWQHLEREERLRIYGETEHKNGIVTDFQGIEHDNVHDYLVSIGKDRMVNDYFYYQDALGEKIKSTLEAHLKIELPDRGMAGIKAIMKENFGLGNGTVADLSSKEVMSEIEQKHHYLEQNWRGHVTDTNFGVRDFQGNFCNRPWEYLCAVGEDHAVYDKINYQSELGIKLKSDLEDKFNRELPERGLADINQHGYRHDLDPNFDRSMDMDLELED